MEQASEFAVSGYSTLAIAQDIDGCEIADGAVGGVDELAEERGMVVVCNGTGVVDSERIDCIGQRRAAVNSILRLLKRKIDHRRRLGMLTSLGVEESDVVGNQRMQTVHGDEFFGERVWHAVLVCSAPWDTAYEL